MTAGQAQRARSPLPARLGWACRRSPAWSAARAVWACRASQQARHPTLPAAGALNRAEWVKFVALFFNLEKNASDIFDAIQARYEAIKVGARRRESQMNDRMCAIPLHATNPFTEPLHGTAALASFAGMREALDQPNPSHPLACCGCRPRPQAPPPSPSWRGRSTSSTTRTRTTSCPLRPTRWAPPSACAAGCV